MRQITMRGAVLASAMALGATITGCGTSGADTEPTCGAAVTGPF